MNGTLFNTGRDLSPRQVVQSYIVTTAMYDFNVYEKRVLYNLVKLAQSQLEGVRLSESLYRIDHTMGDVVHIELPMSYFLTDKDDKNHSRVKTALKSLHQKTFTYTDDENWECFSIIANPKISLRSSKVSFIVDTRVWDVLLDFTKGFSRYNLEVAFSLESCYAMRFYEMMSSQKEPIAYSIESLRRVFRLENKYTLTKDFIRRVIMPAKAELDRKSPVTFTFTPLKSGRKITQILFFPVIQEYKRPQDDFLKETIRRYGIAGGLSADEMRQLREIGFTENGIRNNLPLLMECRKHLDLVYELAMIRGKSREKKSPCGWCIRTLQGKLTEKQRKDDTERH